MVMTNKRGPKLNFGPLLFASRQSDSRVSNPRYAATAARLGVATLRLILMMPTLSIVQIAT